MKTLNGGILEENQVASLSKEELRIVEEHIVLSRQAEVRLRMTNLRSKKVISISRFQSMNFANEHETSCSSIKIQKLYEILIRIFQKAERM